MALITVSGVALPTPSSYQVGVMDISKADRNANGLMIIERITTKVKLQISYDFLTASQLKTVLNAVSSTFYDVTYLDPRTNTMQTTSMYCGDRSVDMIDYINGIPRYKGVSFDLIER